MTPELKFLHRRNRDLPDRHPQGVSGCLRIRGTYARTPCWGSNEIISPFGFRPRRIRKGHHPFLKKARLSVVHTRMPICELGF